jgi:all-trans-retinol dehydrogenase (NAD+)
MITLRKTNRVFLPEMIRKQHGHILSVCSMTALKPAPRGITYSASKAGVRAMMAALQDELFADGMDKFIHTTTIFPWFINTRKELIDNIVNKTP